MSDENGHVMPDVQDGFAPSAKTIAVVQIVNATLGAMDIHGSVSAGETDGPQGPLVVIQFQPTPQPIQIGIPKGMVTDDIAGPPPQKVAADVVRDILKRMVGAFHGAPPKKRPPGLVLPSGPMPDLRVRGD